MRQVEGVRVERGLYQSARTKDEIVAPKPVVAALPVWANLMDLPLLSGGELPEAPWIAATAEPWPGGVSVYSSLDGQSWTYETELSRRAVMGQTQTDLVAARSGLWQRGPGVEVKLAHGALGSVDETALFAGGNVAAIGDTSGVWEVLQFRDATLTAPDTWQLSHLLRGQQGTDAFIPPVWTPGANVVVMDAAPLQLDVPSSLRGVTRMYRVGPASKPVDHASYVDLTHSAGAVGLRPYAPAHLRVVPDGAGGHAMSWIRRTRIDGDNWALPDVPLGEAYEAYRVQIILGGVLHREETTSTPVFTYDVAMRAADGVSAPFIVEVAQISDLYGVGAIARIVIDG